MKGVIAFFTAKDIPGKNVFISAASQQLMMPNDEVVSQAAYKLRKTKNVRDLYFIRFLYLLAVCR